MMRHLLLTMFMLACAFSARGAEPLRIYYLGNSLTDELKYDSFKELAAAGGHPIEWGRHMIPGAPIRWLWTHPKDGFTKGPFGATATAFNYPWDAVTLQPFAGMSELPYAVDYVKRIQEKSPQAQIFVYAQWPGKKYRDWNKMWLQDYSKKTYPAPDSSRTFYEAFLVKLRESVKTEKPILLIPVGHAMHLLNQKIQAGQVPGYKDIFELYSDGVHVSNVASYLVGCTFYATIFKQSPVGLPVVGEYAPRVHPDDHFPISAELARIIQETAWEVVATHPMTGVSSNEPLKIVTPALPGAVAGEPYQFELQPAFGAGPYRWSVEGERLPEGITLSAQGELAGQADVESEVAVKIAVTDSHGARAAREFKWRIEKDTTPEIKTATLPAMRRGEYFRTTLAASGGNGFLTWSKKNGTLPAGVELTPYGELAGTPGQDGEFEATFEAADGDAQPETSERSFTFTVGPAMRDVLLVAKAAAAPQIDGKPGEGEWKFDQKIEKLVKGDKSSVKAEFASSWDEKNLYLAVRVHGVKPQKGKADSVEIFIDALNNREGTYNFDDRRIVIESTGQRTKASVGDVFGSSFKGGATDSGYAIEASIPWKSLGFRTSYANRAVGLDIAVNHEAGQGANSQLVWRGDARNGEDSSHFGTAIMVE